MADNNLLRNREIIDILIGDSIVYENYRMPYYSGPQLCELSTLFGLPVSYVWGGTNKSRWQYMDALLSYTIKTNKIFALFSYIFDFARFKSLNITGNSGQIKSTYHNIVEGALSKINGILLFSNHELILSNKQFVLHPIGENIVIPTPKVSIVTYQYIQELPERIKNDIENKDYDSVVTKSRTLLEEVFIYIIEKLTKERYQSDGNLTKIYAEAKGLLGISQKKEWDKRINDLLSGINKIVDAIGNMRNMNSDAHGAGSNRIAIKEREAHLIASSAMMVSEYILSIYNKDRD